MNNKERLLGLAAEHLQRIPVKETILNAYGYDRQTILPKIVELNNKINLSLGNTIDQETGRLIKLNNDNWGNVYVPDLLDQALLGFDNVEGEWLHKNIAPQIPVRTKTGKIPSVDGSHLRLINTEVAEGGKTPLREHKTEISDGWNLKRHAIAQWIENEEITGNELLITPQALAIRGGVQTLTIAREYALKSFMSSTDTNEMPLNLTLSNSADKFSSYTTSNPIDVINARIEAIADACGYVPNYMAMDMKVARVLAQHPKVKEYLGSTIITYDILQNHISKIFPGIETLEFTNVKYGEVVNGKEVVKSIWDKNIYIAKVGVLSGIGTAFAQSFARSGQDLEIKQVTNGQEVVDRDAIYMHIQTRYDQLVINNNAGATIIGAIA